MRSIFIIFTLIRLIFGICPNESLSWNLECYFFFNESTGFADAELNCHKNSGHLVSIHDAFTNTLLAQEASKCFQESTESDFWIGANFLGPKSWNWTDESKFDYTDWKENEPQNTSGSDCAALSLTNGYWSAQDCFKAKPFVCEIPSSHFTPTTTPFPNFINCSTGWTYFQPTRSCYGKSEGSIMSNWSTAETYCENLGAHLPSIHSYEEFQFLLSYVYHNWYALWLGLYSIDSQKTWTWTDGSPVDYTKWVAGSPSNISGESCVMLLNLGSTRDGFYDHSCSKDGEYIICKKPMF